MFGKISPSFGSKLVIGDDAQFKLMQIACKKNIRTPEEGTKYVNEMIDKYQKKFEQIDDDAVITVNTDHSTGDNAKISIYDFEFVSSKKIYENKNGEMVPYIPRLPFKDKIKHQPSDSDYVRGLQPGVEYPSVEHVLRKAYELAQDVKASTNYNFIPPVPTLFK